MLAPGVPLTHPAPHWTVGLARNAARRGDRRHRAVLPRAAQASRPTAPFVAITGTNGKSTTTALIAHLLRSGRTTTCSSAAISAPRSCRCSRRAPGRVHVIECSSYPDRSRAVARSVGRHPAQRHARTISTATARSRITRRSRSGWSRACSRTAPRSSASTTTGARRSPTASSTRGKRVVRVSVRRPLSDGLYVEAEQVMRAAGGTARAVAQIGGIGSLRGAHNAQNAACATAAGAGARPVAGGDPERARARFPASRTAWSRSAARATVLFVNDSKATNADAAARALASFTDIFWIAGGKPRPAASPRSPATSRASQGLSDRRGGGRVRRHAAGQGAVRGRRHARPRGRARGARCAGVGR